MATEYTITLLIALAVGMDAFSLSMSVAMRGIRFFSMIKLSFFVGLFHFLMPLIGIFFGRFMSGYFGEMAIILGGSLLVLLGFHMIVSSFRSHTSETVMNPISLISLIFFAFMVSIDALSVGLTMGVFTNQILYVIFMFGITGWLMSFSGLVFGNIVGRWIGGYGEALGGMILCAFGLVILL